MFCMWVLQNMSQSQSYDDENKPSTSLTLSELKSTSKLQLFNDPQKGLNPYGLLSFVEHKIRFKQFFLTIQQKSNGAKQHLDFHFMDMDILFSTDERDLQIWNDLRE